MFSPHFDQTLVPIVEALRMAQPEAAIAPLQMLLARKLTPPQTAHARALLAQAYEFTSQWDDATRLLRPYEDRMQRKDLPLATQHLLCRRLASLSTETGDLPTALHFAREALRLAEQENNASDQGEAHQALGRAYRLLGQPVFARQHYQSALNLHQTLGARVLMARSYFGLSAVATGSSEYALARQSLQRAFNLITEADDPLLFGLLCSMQAATLTLEETAPLAERVAWFARAHSILARIDHRRFLARVLGNWGDQLIRVGNWQEGERLLQEALTLSQQLQDWRSHANILEALAELAMRQGKYAISQQYVTEALRWIEGRDHFVELQVRLAAARLGWQQGQVAEARQMFAQIVTRARETEAKQWQVAAQLSLADMCLSEGQGASAEELLQECRGAVEKLRSLGLTGHLRWLEGRLACAQQQFVAAREALEQARTMFEVSGQRWWLGRTRLALADVWLALEQHEAVQETLQEAEADFAAVAAQPCQQQLRMWRQQHAVRVMNAPRELAPLRLPESEGVGRLLRAVGFREVFLRELLTLLQTELPGHHITLSELSDTEAPHLLLASAAPLTEQKKASATFRLEPWQDAPLEVRITPAPRLTPNLSRLLQAARIGLEACAARERATFTTASEQQAEHLERALPGLLYQSQAMRALAAAIHQIQGSEVTVLLLGESGTGKELVARALHALSQRRTHPFVPFNCANLSADLLASQFFGHRKGAFTGATEKSDGVIRAAEGGTLFLDEIGELPWEVQPKLLRFLQDGEIHPLGAGTPEKVNVRVIAATNRSLEEMVKAGRFREDLYFRLNIIPLRVPALRERREEIPLLARHFLQHHGAATQKPNVTLSPEALDLLTTHDWPGNVRQLENEMQRLLAYWPGGTLLRPEHLSAEILQRPQTSNGQAGNGAATESLNDQLLRLERSLLEQCLARHPRNVNQAAAALGLKRRTFYDKLRRHGIPPPTET
ncbi:MAG: sigma 54-interacting transcriptional regulator [Blastocatellia bacterium]|nr:sigma 54-interacting transcriptional regulator [Blastocatellia bacterium]